MHYWVGALERLAHDKRSRRLTVAISQVGGKELIAEILDTLYRRRRRGDFDHETFDALCDLNGALTALEELEEAPTSGLARFRTRYRALLLIRDLRSRALRYLECCSAGENPSARANLQEAPATPPLRAPPLSPSTLSTASATNTRKTSSGSFGARI